MTFGQWLLWFVRTPPRFLGTVAGVAVLYGLFNPQVVETAVHNLLVGFFRAVSPFVEPALTLTVMVVGSAWALRKAFGGKKGGAK